MLLIGDGHGIDLERFRSAYILDNIGLCICLWRSCNFRIVICNLVIWLIRWGNVCASATSWSL